MLTTLGFMIVTSAVLIVLLQGSRIPNLLLYIFAGLLLGPLLGWIPSEDAHGPVHVIGEVGIALLLFVVGLELSFERIRDVGPVAVAAGLGQVVFTAAFGFLLALALGFDPLPAFFIATALTFSSTVVVVKLLDQRGDLHALYGRIAVGIFLVQDMVVVVALTVLAGLAGAGEAAQMDAQQIGIDLMWAFAGMTSLLFGSLLASRFILPKPFNWMVSRPEGLLVWAISWCFLLVLGAEAFSLSPEIGAFLAGVSLAQLPCAHDMQRRIHPLMSFFIAIFFVSLGAHMELSAAVQQLPSALALSAFVLIGNPLIFMFIIARFGYDEKTTFQTSVTVAQISEFSFIFTSMGISTGLIEADILSIVALVGLVTISASTYMILYSDELYEWIRDRGLLRIFRARQGSPPPPPPPGRQGHIVVVGMNDLGRRIVEALHERGEDVVAVDVDAHKLRDLASDTLVGDIHHPDVLEASGALRAKLVVSALHIESANHLLAWRCKQAGVPTAIHAFDRSVRPDLEQLGVAHIMDAKALGGNAIHALIHPPETPA